MRGLLPTLLIACIPLCAGAQAKPINTAALDESRQRAGQVQRLTGTIGGWSVACDELIGLRRRFCSLWSFGVDASGAHVVGLTISTSDDGHPAALLRLPLGVILKRGVEVSADPRDRGLKPGSAREPPARLKIDACDGLACSVVWSLSDAQREVLMRSGTISFRFFRTTAEARSILLNRSPRAAPIEAVVDCAGFSEAVAASLK